jgi:hypothetical protein
MILAVGDLMVEVMAFESIVVEFVVEFVFDEH